MKTIYFFLLTSFFTHLGFSQDIIISGVGHGYNTNAGFIELYVINDFDFDQYRVYTVSGNGSLIGQAFIFGPKSAGDRIYIATDNYFFEPFFGFPATLEESAAHISGDDIVILEYNYTSIVDIYGVEGVDGTGTEWDYIDGWAYRLNGLGPNTTFTASEWEIHTDTFDFCGSTNASCPIPYPNGSYTLSINHPQLGNIRVSPNPVDQGFVNIFGIDPLLVNIEVYNTIGQHIIKAKLYNSRLDLSELSAGIYFLKISQDKVSTIKKLVIR